MLSSVALEFMFLLNLKQALDSLRPSLALVVHDVTCPGQVIPFSGPQPLVGEMRRWTVLPVWLLSALALPAAVGGALGLLLLAEGILLFSSLFSETRLDLSVLVLPRTGSYICPYDLFLTKGLVTTLGAAVSTIQNTGVGWGDSFVSLCRRLCSEPLQRPSSVMTF